MRTKLLLIVSSSLNVALVAAAGYFWLTRPAPPLPSVAAAPAPPPVAAPSAPSHWSWSQIESDNLMVFMDNLHAIGCPEDIIRRIVNLDEPGTSAAHDGQRVTSNGLPAFQATGTLQPGGQPQSQYASRTATGPVASGYGTGAGPAANDTVAPGAAPDSGRGVGYAARPPVLPLAFQPVSLTDAAPAPGVGSATGNSRGVATPAATLNDAQKAAIAGVQNEFTNQLSGTSQNPNDPAYAQQWTAAQRQADDLLRAMLGDAAFNQYQLKAAQQAATQGK